MTRELRVLVDDVPPAGDVEHDATAIGINRLAGRHSTAGAGTLAGVNAASRRSSSSGRAFALTYRSVVASFECPRKSRTNTASEVRATRLPAAWRRPCSRTGRRPAAAHPLL